MFTVVSLIRFNRFISQNITRVNSYSLLWEHGVIMTSMIPAKKKLVLWYSISLPITKACIVSFVRLCSPSSTSFPSLTLSPSTARRWSPNTRARRDAASRMYRRNAARRPHARCHNPQSFGCWERALAARRAVTRRTAHAPLSIVIYLHDGNVRAEANVYMLQSLNIIIKSRQL